MTARAAPGWREFWDVPASVYFSDRHKAVHYRRVADHVIEALPGRSDLVLLDYGCGEALEAERLASRLQRLLLFDPSSFMRNELRRRFGAAPRVEILADAARIEKRSVDVVVVNSVIQYIRPAEFDSLLGNIAEWLRASGFLILADVIPKRAGMAAETAAVLRQALRHGYFFAALVGLAKTFSSDYRRIRGANGFATYDEDEILRMTAKHGLDARRQRDNFGLNPRRMTFLCQAG